MRDAAVDLVGDCSGGDTVRIDDMALEVTDVGERVPQLFERVHVRQQIT
jgi:hypothetical protein